MGRRGPLDPPISLRAGQVLGMLPHQSSNIHVFDDTKKNHGELKCQNQTKQISCWKIWSFIHHKFYTRNSAESMVVPLRKGWKMILILDWIKNFSHLVTCGSNILTQGLTSWKWSLHFSHLSSGMVSTIHSQNAPRIKKKILTYIDPIDLSQM